MFHQEPILRNTIDVLASRAVKEVHHAMASPKTASKRLEPPQELGVAEVSSAGEGHSGPAALKGVPNGREMPLAAGAESCCRRHSRAMKGGGEVPGLVMRGGDTVTGFSGHHVGVIIIIARTRTRTRAPARRLLLLKPLPTQFL